jgi:hypothetical protein
MPHKTSLVYFLILYIIIVRTCNKIFKVPIVVLEALTRQVFDVPLGSLITKGTLMLNFGILGTGRMAVRLADLAAKSGHEILLGSRTLSRSTEIANKLGNGMKGGTYDDAMTCDIIMPSIFIRDGAFESLKPLADKSKGKIVVDILNPFNATYDDFTLPWDTSAAEELQKIWPEARIVSIFKWPFWESFENNEFEGGPMDVIYTGDDQEAKAIVLELFKASPWRFLDGGGLAQARFTERMTLFCGQLGARYGYLPRVGWRLLGEPWSGGRSDTYANIIQRWDRP